MSSIRKIDIKNRTYYLFDHMFNIKSLDPNKIKIDEKPNKKILLYQIGYVAVKNLSWIKSISVNPLKLIIDKIKGTLKKVIEINIWR